MGGGGGGGGGVGWGGGTATNIQISTPQLTKDLIIPAKLLISPVHKKFNNFLDISRPCCAGVNSKFIRQRDPILHISDTTRLETLHRAQCLHR